MNVVMDLDNFKGVTHHPMRLNPDLSFGRPPFVFVISGIPVPEPYQAGDYNEFHLPLDWRRGDNEKKWGRDRRFALAYVDTFFETDPKDRLL